MIPTAIVVDDSEDIQKALCSILEVLNIKIIGKAYNGFEAVSLYEKVKPRFVFLDLLMPKYDGFYALKKIKKFNPNATIIVITADARNKTQEIVNELGATILYKPFTVEQIQEVLKQYGNS